MPKLREYKEAYQYYSATASSINRQLTLGGIAIIWLFRGGDGWQVELPDVLVFAAAALVVSLAIDLAQYAYLTGWWCKYYDEQYDVVRSQANGDPDEQNVEVPEHIWKHADSVSKLFYVKITMTGVAYTALVIFLLWNLRLR